MSADNWAICPRCRAEEQARIDELRQRSRDGYGVLPVDEFDALRAEAEKPLDENALSTFREDYEIYGAGDGTIKVSYSGHCEKCGVGIDFEFERSFWTPPERRL